MNYPLHLGVTEAGEGEDGRIKSAMGLYQVDPVGGRFVIGSPIFDKASVNVGGDKK